MESLGRRIAKQRADLGWTQQELADRVAVSRVAVSHLESDLSTAGERTVALLAGVFGMEPHELVAGTTYPAAKADRLPLVVARHTEVELQCRLLDRDLELFARSGDRSRLDGWTNRLADLAAEVLDPRQRTLLDQAGARLRHALSST
ncbi:MAG: helix-turn-helix domain-containing protein [Acidimicrobiales bacterium]